MPGLALLALSGPQAVTALAAELVANRMRARRNLRVLLPTGRTPLAMYAVLRAHAADGSLAHTSATAFQLDEYRGLDAADPRSYRSYLRRELAGIHFAGRHELRAEAADAAAECARYQALLAEAPIDLAVLGLGRDGHVAFDEPGSLLDAGVHEVELHPTTRADAAADFGGIDGVPRRALTVGLSTLHEARELLVLVTGEAKAEALRAMLELAPSADCPASLLRSHPRLTVVADRAAASSLRAVRTWDSDHVMIVLGHREAGVSAEHRISRESLDRLRRAERIAQDEPARAVILTGYTSTAGLAEAEQMALAWSSGDVPALLEVAGRNTAENATCSLPLILAMGGVRHVTVVTSGWHLRAPYFFAPYRRHGLSLSFRFVALRGSWSRMVRQELRSMPAARSQRRAAVRAMRLPPAGSAPQSGDP
jgi:glucosamine-6-phosphate deaminase